MSRFTSLVLLLVMVGCVQRATPFVPTGSQAAIPNAGPAATKSAAAKPADFVVAHVAFKNEAFHSGYHTEFTVYWSYAANPFWHVQLRECVEPGHEVHADVIYHHIKNGPQIKFSAEIVSKDFLCTLFRGGYRDIAFHKMNFTPDADFHVVYQKPSGKQTKEAKLCARGGGNAQVCDDPK